MMRLVLSVAVLTAPTMSNFDVTTGYYSTCAAYDGEVKCWGQNEKGQLATGDAIGLWEPPTNPIDLGTDSLGADFVADSVDCGEWQCCALSAENELKCWGWCTAIGCDPAAGYGAGVGDAEEELGNLPLLPCFEDVVDMAVLRQLTCVLENHGGEFEIECVGEDYGDYILGIGGITTWADGPVALDLSDVTTGWTEVSGLGGGHWTVCAFDSNTADALECWGNVDVDWSVVGGLTIQAVRCGTGHCCALTVDHSLECWGSNGDGRSDTSQLGDDFGEVQDFSVGRHSTCALSTDRKVSCFGEDHYGQLGGGSFDIPSAFTESGVRLAHSSNTYYHFCVYEETNELLLQCWGRNQLGQLGYGDTDNREDGGNLGFVVLGWTVSAPAPAPVTVPSTPSPVKFVSFGAACNGLTVEDMYGYIIDSPSTGEYEDCVCDADTLGSHAVAVSEAIAGTVSFPESTVPDEQYLTFSCVGQPTDIAVCNDDPSGSDDYRWGLAPGTALPADGVPTSSFGRYHLHRAYPGHGILLCSSDSPTPSPTLPPTQCFPTFSGFVYEPYDGQWTPVEDASVNEHEVYFKQTPYSANDGVRYLWLKTDTWNGNPAWVISDDYNDNDLYRGWKWGEDLYDGANWWYVSNGWVLHSTPPDMSCSAAEASAAVSISGAVWKAETEGESHIEPGSPSANFIPMVVGAAIAALVVAGIAAFVISIKRKRSGKKEETEMAKVVHVPEASPASVDGVETI